MVAVLTHLDCIWCTQAPQNLANSYFGAYHDAYQIQLQRGDNFHFFVVQLILSTDT